MKNMASASSFGARPVSPDRPSTAPFNVSTSEADRPTNVSIWVIENSKSEAIFPAASPRPTSGIVTFMVIDLPALDMFLPNWAIEFWASVMPFLNCVVSAVTIALTIPTVAMSYRLIRWRA